MISYSGILGEDVRELHDMINKIEEDYAKLVDDYQAGVINRYNRER